MPFNYQKSDSQRRNSFFTLPELQSPFFLTDSAPLSGDQGVVRLFRNEQGMTRRVKKPHNFSKQLKGCSANFAYDYYQRAYPDASVQVQIFDDGDYRLVMPDFGVPIWDMVIEANPAYVLNLLGKVVTEIQRIHGLGIVHGDLCSQNILVNRDGNIRIIDPYQNPQRTIKSDLEKLKGNLRSLAGLVSKAAEVKMENAHYQYILDNAYSEFHFFWHTTIETPTITYQSLYEIISQARESFAEESIWPDDNATLSYAFRIKCHKLRLAGITKTGSTATHRICTDALVDEVKQTVLRKHITESRAIEICQQTQELLQSFSGQLQPNQSMNSQTRLLDTSNSQKIADYLILAQSLEQGKGSRKPCRKLASRMIVLAFGLVIASATLITTFGFIPLAASIGILFTSYFVRGACSKPKLQQEAEKIALSSCKLTQEKCLTKLKIGFN